MAVSLLTSLVLKDTWQWLLFNCFLNISSFWPRKLFAFFWHYYTRLNPSIANWLRPLNTHAMRYIIFSSHLGHLPKYESRMLHLNIISRQHIENNVLFRLHSYHKQYHCLSVRTLLKRWSQSSCFGLHPSGNVLFTSAQMNCTKEVNVQGFDSAKLNRAGVKARYNRELLFSPIVS